MSATSISVITVCRNAEKAIQDAADSVLAALGAGDEWVLQDGASTDGTLEFLRSLQYPGVRLESQPDNGIYDAMNRAVRRASGDFILFIGADDRLCIRLDDMRGRLSRPRTLYYGDVWRITSQDRYAGAFDGRKLSRTNICQQAIFYPACVFAKHAFDCRYPHQADWVFNMACFADPSIEFEYIPEIVAEYGQGGLSSMRMDTAFQRDYRRLLRRYFTLRQCWRPAVLSLLSDFYRALPGVPAPNQKPARRYPLKSECADTYE